jgi:hypothetical protein
MKHFARAALVVGMLLAGALAQAQEAKSVAPAVAPAARPAARPADVASVDAIMAALYDVVSGPAGKVRDWDRLRSLFTADGKMGAVGARPGGEFAHRAMTVDDYIARNTKFFSESGFFESEMARHSDAFGQITHVFSTYEARKAPADAKPFMRGINSVQLYNDGARWWIISLLWRAEDDKLSLPEKYLKSH